MGLMKGDVLHCDNKHNLLRIAADFVASGTAIAIDRKEYTITLLEDEREGGELDDRT